MARTSEIRITHEVAPDRGTLNYRLLVVALLFGIRADQVSGWGAVAYSAASVGAWVWLNVNLWRDLRGSSR